MPRPEFPKPTRFARRSVKADTSPMNRTLASLVMLAAMLPAGLPSRLSAQPATAAAPLEVRLQAKLDSAYKQGKFPGATLGIAFADGKTLALAVGMADTSKREAMKP